MTGKVWRHPPLTEEYLDSWERYQINKGCAHGEPHVINARVAILIAEVRRLKDLGLYYIDKQKEEMATLREALEEVADCELSSTWDRHGRWAKVRERARRALHKST